MKYSAIPSTLFIENRRRFAAQMKPDSIAVFVSNDEMPRSADATYFWRQNPDLFYLSGIDQEQTILLLYPDCPNPKQREILFVRKTNELIAIWEGHKYTKEEATQASGIENIQWTDGFEGVFRVLMTYAKTIYLNQNDHDRAVSKVPYLEMRFATDVKAQFPAHQVERASPIMHALRSIKSDFEVAVMRTACDITEKAFKRVLGFMKPGVWEYEVEAEIIHEFIRNRATGHAYTPIIASGGSACVLHYIDNNKQCNDGDVVLMDFGAEYGNYNADLTRSVPVNGRFTKRQKDVYNAVLRVMKYAKTMLRPGTIPLEYTKEVGLAMENELIDLGLLEAAAVKKQDPDNPLYKKYFMHGTSHYLGLDVHDVGFRYAPFEAGMVFTCEPGIYIPEESLGIRLENDILITKEGPLDLMQSIPLEAEEIEDIMQSNQRK
ncbi:MAG: aminopeptidase P N-terminal domain-containing protein [Bacteroidia bacterium]|nr:aminopeptidase P N-terminal domain-containing protein [Bacteroidia bacterium]